MSQIQYFPMPGGSFDVTAVKDNNGDPAQNLEAALPIVVEGNFVINAGNAITGEATITLYVDQLGGTIDQAVGSTTVTVVGDGTYPWTVTVPGKTLPDAPPATGSNLYRVAAVLTMKNSNGAGTETTAFVEMGMYGIS